MSDTQRPSASRPPGLPPGYVFSRLTETGSTSDVARSLAADMLALGRPLVVQALSQTGGRGRDGRPWHSPPGNLYVTVLLPLEQLRPDIGLLSLAAATAMAEGAARRLPKQRVIGYKWPNDLLLDGGKFCGLLLECGLLPGGAWASIGAGVNITDHPAALPYPATHLNACGYHGDPELLLGDYMQRLDAWVDRWRAGQAANIRDAWMQGAVGLHQPMTARLPGGRTVQGVFRGLDIDGALLLDGENGRQRILAGDVFPALSQPLFSAQPFFAD